VAIKTIVIISDTHGMHDKLAIPEGDILIHAGDMCNAGKLREVVEFNDWIGDLPHEHKIVIAGNHDWCFERQPNKTQAILTNCTYLQDSSVEIDGLKFFGSPWQPEFCNGAFNIRRGHDLRIKWSTIPDDVDVLITHCPPFGFGDGTFYGESAGCVDLAKRVKEIRPRLHAFGHIHEGYGRWDKGGTTYVNGSSCNFNYQPVNPPLVFQI